MGKLLDALTPPSAYRVKKDHPDLWAEIVDRIEGAMFPAMLLEVEVWLATLELQLPERWDLNIQELLERRREELAEEDIGKIVRDRFDFT